MEGQEVNKVVLVKPPVSTRRLKTVVIICVIGIVISDQSAFVLGVLIPLVSSLSLCVIGFTAFIFHKKDLKLSTVIMGCVAFAFLAIATFRRKNAVCEAALIACGRNGVILAVHFRPPAQFDRRKRGVVRFTFPAGQDSARSGSHYRP